MLGELDILKIVSERLGAAGIEFMLTGSYALAYYATPRMTRDLDLVVALEAASVDPLVAAFAADFYIDADDVFEAVAAQRMFNLMHLMSGIKVDFIVRKQAEYRQVEFARRRRVDLGGVPAFVVSREDLILSKLLWARESKSELQLRDVRALLDGPLDHAYLRHWAASLGVDNMLDEVSRA